MGGIFVERVIACGTQVNLLKGTKYGENHSVSALGGDASRQALSKTVAERLLGRNMLGAHVKR